MGSGVLILIALCALMLGAAYKLVPSDKYKYIFILLAFAALLLRVATVIYLYRNGPDTFGTDGLLYHKEGILAAQQLADGVPFYAVKYTYTWYTVFVGLIYHIFGVNRYIVSYVNIALTFFSALLLLKIAINNKYKYSNAVFISLAFLYFPNMILWTSDSRKEALLIFISILCWHQVQCFICRVESGEYSKAGEYIRILFVCVLIWLGTLVRIYMFMPLAVGILLSQFLFYKKTHRRIILLFAAAVIISSVIISIVTVYPLLDGYHAITFPEETNDLSDDIANKWKVLKLIASGRNAFVSTVNYILIPYPGKINIADISFSKPLQFVVSCDMIAWYFCLLSMLPGIYSAARNKNRYLLGILAFLAAYILINAMVVENVPDTIYRYRSTIVGTSLLFIDWDALSLMAKRSKGILLHGDSHIKIYNTGSSNAKNKIRIPIK